MKKAGTAPGGKPLVMRVSWSVHLPDEALRRVHDRTALERDIDGNEIPALAA